MNESETDLPGRAKVLLRAMRNPTASWSCFNDPVPWLRDHASGGFYLERVPGVGRVTIEALVRGGFVEVLPAHQQPRRQGLGLVYRLRDFWWLDQTWWWTEDFGDLWID